MSHRSCLEISLNREVVLPLLDFIAPVMKALSEGVALAMPPGDDEDDELAEVWSRGLLDTQIDDCAILMGLFDDAFRKSGTIRIESERVDHILRAASAIRLKVRESCLAHLPDAALEGGDFDFDGLDDRDRSGFAAYFLFATLQEIIIRHLEG